MADISFGHKTFVIKNFMAKKREHMIALAHPSFWDSLLYWYGKEAWKHQCYKNLLMVEKKKKKTLEIMWKKLLKGSNFIILFNFLA